MRVHHGTLALSEHTQRQLCAGTDGRAAATLEFAFNRTDFDARIILTSRHHRVVREALGRPASEALPEACRKIDCDCPAVYNFMGQWRKVCYDAERALKASCARSGRVQGHCDAVMKGPDAWPK